MAGLEIDKKEFEEERRQELLKRLKQIRERLGTQDKLAHDLYGNQGQISRYESGKRKAPLDYIRQLSRKAGVPFTEEQYLLGLAGAGVPTRMPSAEQIKNDMEIYCRDIAHDWYPSLIVDHNFGIWVMNEAAYDVLGENRTKELIGQYVTMLEMIFSDSLEYKPQNSVHEVLTHESYKTRLQQITLFKLFNIQRRHEAFYRYYPQHLGYIGSDKPRIQAKNFVPMWKQVDIVGSRGELQFKEGKIEIRGVLPARESIDIRYRQRLEPIPHLPMFCIVRFEPSPEFEPIFARYKWVSKKLIKLWEIRDVEPILQGIDGLNLL